MDITKLERLSDTEWLIPQSGEMRVPAIIFADERLIVAMDEKVKEQITNVATLPGIVKAAYAMPDAHWGYGFPIGGVAAFDPEEGVVSAGGVGFDISCLTADAEVLHAHGYRRPIAEMARTWPDEAVALQDLEAKRPAAARVCAFMRKVPDTPVYRVKTATGRTIKATADHPFYTPRGMVPLGELRPGDRVALYPFEGVAYEAPREERLLTEEAFLAFIAQHGKGRRGNAAAQILNQLKGRGLLPLSYDHPKLPYLLKLMGYVMGDGTLTHFRDGRWALGFYGHPEDLEAIRADIAALGFRALPVTSRPRRHRIRTAYREVRFSTVEHMTRASSTALALLLAALGCPIGEKAAQSYRVPAWIRRAPLWQQRLFLSAFFSAEMSAPRAQSEKNFACPSISASKVLERIGNARAFLEDIAAMLSAFGIEHLAISRVRDDYRRADGTRSGRYRLLLSNRPQHLIALYEGIGFVYHRRKQVQGLWVAHYLRAKERVKAARVAAAEEALVLRQQHRGAVSIQRAMGGDIPLRFIERTLYEGRKTAPRVWDFPAFEAFSKEATAGLGSSGMVWDTLEALEPIPSPRWVYDVTVDHPSHDFIANGFVVSNCGVRALRTGLKAEAIEGVKETLADALFYTIPAGVGSRGKIRLSRPEMDAMLKGGARWAVEQGWGVPEDLTYIEEEGCMAGADPSAVSDRAKERQEREMGTLGSGNHYLEVQRVAAIYDEETAQAYGIALGDAVVSIHCGSRGLGHQIGTDYLRLMVKAAAEYGIKLPDRELACAPIRSPVGQRYLGAMRAGINCALANRQIITHLTREAFARILPEARLTTLYDVSHNTCKAEDHKVEGVKRHLYVHRKGATRAFGPGHPLIPEDYRAVGQPVLIGGSMGTASYILAGTEESEEKSFSSACHGAGRSLSRHQAAKQWRGEQVIAELARRGIIVRSHSKRGVAEEAPEAYKDVSAVVEAAHKARLARLVARLEPIITIKG